MTTTPATRPTYVVIDVETHLVYGGDPTRRLIAHLEDAAAARGYSDTREIFSRLGDAYRTTIELVLRRAAQNLGFEVLFARSWSPEAAEWLARNDGSVAAEEITSAATDIWEEADWDGTLARVAEGHADHARFIAAGVGLAKTP